MKPDSNPSAAAPLILSLDTSSAAAGSVAIMRGARVLATRSWGGGEGRSASESQSSTVLAEIHNALERAELTLAQIELFAATTGPGSFTALRIGLATIKSFAATLRKPCVGVPTLEAIAAGASENITAGDAVIACLPAGRGEVFAQMFAAHTDKRLYPIDEPAHLAPNALFERVARSRQPSVLWTGPWAVAAADSIADFVRERFAEEMAYEQGADAAPKTNQMGEKSIRWVISSAGRPVAVEAASIALGYYERDRLLRAEELQALYVRRPDIGN